MHYLESPLHAIVIFVLVLALCFIGVIVKRKLTPHQLPFPPGPKGIPFIGSALEMNRRKPWLTFAEWKETYGEVISYTGLGQMYVIVNSERLAKMLEQCSNIYTGGSLVRTCTLSIIDEYHDSVTEAVRALLANLLSSPNDFERHMTIYAASIVTFITYGYNVNPSDDFLEAAVEEMAQIVNLMTPERAALFNRFPQPFNLSSWFPSAELVRLAKRYKEVSAGAHHIPFRFVKECLSGDTKKNYTVAEVLENNSRDHVLHERDMKDWATSSFIGKKSDRAVLDLVLLSTSVHTADIYTIQSSLSTLIMALSLYPEVQDRAQAEIDKIVGRDRLATFDDRASLQYVDALLRETLRWSSLVPMAVSHSTTKDIILDQRLVPKGSIVIHDLWGMARDEETYPYPTAFTPERHLDKDGKLLPDDVSGLYFGHEPGFYPGRHLTDVSIWLAATNMLSLFRFSKATGTAGYKIDVFPKFTGSIMRRPASFSCCITPRFAETMEFVDESKHDVTTECMLDPDILK